jgi:3-hydroxyacyl-[acyl-carrier-protein] dehydratase
MGFRLVDRILELEALKRIVALKEIKPDEDYFPDHFPGYPVMPGVLQVESMAQAAGKCLMAGIDASKWPVLIQVRQANFRKAVPPGSLLRIEAEIQSLTQGTAIANARIRCDGQPVSDATLVFGFVRKDQLLAGYQDEVLQAYLNPAGGRP